MNEWRSPPSSALLSVGNALFCLRAYLTCVHNNYVRTHNPCQAIVVVQQSRAGGTEAAAAANIRQNNGLLQISACTQFTKIKTTLATHTHTRDCLYAGKFCYSPLLIPAPLGGVFTTSQNHRGKNLPPSLSRCCRGKEFTHIKISPPYSPSLPPRYSGDALVVAAFYDAHTHNTRNANT